MAFLVFYAVLVSFATSQARSEPVLTDLLQQVLFREPNAHLSILSKLSDAPHYLERTFLSPAHRLAAQQLHAWMADSGMEAWVDVLGNVHGRLNTSSTAASSGQFVVMGSHYDTVIDAGSFDGPLGIIVAIASVKALLVQQAASEGRLGELSAKEDGDVVVPPALARTLLAGAHGVHVIGFTDEEGLRFQSTFLGSRAVAGSLVQYGMLSSRDKHGLSLLEVLEEEWGIPGHAAVAAAMQALALPPASILEYVEVHIEQGPVLEQQGLPLGVVSAIAGQTRLWVTLKGMQGHAGTVPMPGRKDSVAAAAEAIFLLESMCTRDDVDIAEMLVCTVGEVVVRPGASNVISGLAEFSVDIRAKGDALRLSVVDEFIDTLQQLCARRSMECSVVRKHDAAAVLSDSALVSHLAGAVATAQALVRTVLPAQHPSTSTLIQGLQRPPLLVSGAGHDAMAIAEVAKMAMLFVRCRGGISHNPLEYAAQEDVAVAAAATTTYLHTRLTRSSDTSVGDVASHGPPAESGEDRGIVHDEAEL